MSEITVEDLKLMFLALFKNKLLISLFTLAGLNAGLLYSAEQPRGYLYDATATVSVTFGANLGQIPGNVVISNYAEIVTSNRVCGYAATLLAGEGLTERQIQRMIHISVSGNSHVLRISARSPSPRTAILVANAVADSFVTQVSILTGNNSIQVLDAARSAYIVPRREQLNVRIIAPIVAFAAACVLVALMELFSNKVRSVRQCIADDGELLVVIPKVEIKS